MFPGSRPHEADGATLNADLCEIQLPRLGNEQIRLGIADHESGRPDKTKGWHVGCIHSTAQSTATTLDYKPRR